MIAQRSVILVVDDQEEDAVVMSTHLTAIGFGVEVAQNAEVALGKLQKKRPSLVILDMRLPDMFGMDTLKRIKEIDQNIPVILVTAYHNNEEAKRAFSLGATDYLSKPIDFSYLKNTVKNILEDSSQ